MRAPFRPRHALFTAFLLAVACDDSNDASGDDASMDDGGGDPLEIIGDYVEEIPDGGGTIMHSITRDDWTQDSEFGTPVYDIARFDNEADELIAQADASNEFNPGMFSKFQWTEDDGALFYCQVVFDAETEAAAEAAPDADPSQPRAGGCGEFPWSRLTSM